MSLATRLRRRPAPGGGDAGRQTGALFAEIGASGPAPLRGRPPHGLDELQIAFVIPSFKAGSGGHATVVALAQALRDRGHTPSLWLEDCAGWHLRETAAQTTASFRSSFGANELRFEPSFERWAGADIVLATGWQTVPRVLLLPDAGARAYLVQDHEPDFYAASAERLWAESTYRTGLHCIAASPWLAGLLHNRYGASANHFDLALDHGTYRPGGGAREPQLVAFYARSSTPRRAVPLGLLALEVLAERRPDVELALFGQGVRSQVPFRCEQLGVLAPAALAELYARASVGVVLSLTNPSLVCLEMMACGLPCVELASDPMRESFGTDSPLQLAQATPEAIVAAIERMLAPGPAREQVREQGLALAGTRTWEAAAEQVLAGIEAAVAR